MVAARSCCGPFGYHCPLYLSHHSPTAGPQGRSCRCPQAPQETQGTGQSVAARRGKLSLPQACDQLYQNARMIYPRWLDFLRKVAGNMAMKKKMACNLVDFFRFEAEGNHSFFEVAARLE